MKPGVLELLSFLEEHQIPKVVASSNQRAVIELLLKKNNLFERFETIVFRRECPTSKNQIRKFFY